MPDVADDADDAPPRVAAGSEPETSADGILPGPCLAREPLVDDDDRFRLASIGDANVASGFQRHAHGGEIAWRHHLISTARFAAGRRWRHAFGQVPRAEIVAANRQ